MPESGITLVGILNVTPDSFSDGGRYLSLDTQLGAAEAMCDAGVDIIEVGGESTRPGAGAVSSDKECARVVPVIRALGERLEVELAVDTSKSAVAREALTAGAAVVNDVTALQGDPAMGEVLAAATCRVVLMHMKGTPRDMQKNPGYDDVIEEIHGFLAARLAHAEAVGIARERCVVDPGIGFGKRVSDNCRILRELPRFNGLGCPVMIGASRKSFIGRITGRELTAREIGTAAAHMCALHGGAAWLRVHDVAAARDVVRMWAAVRDATVRYDDVKG